MCRRETETTGDPTVLLLLTSLVWHIFQIGVTLLKIRVGLKLMK
jgi:hypothetical protein